MSSHIQKSWWKTTAQEMHHVSLWDNADIQLVELSSSGSLVLNSVTNAAVSTTPGLTREGLLQAPTCSVHLNSDELLRKMS